MDFDKNTDELEHQLKVLGQKIRIDILKKLNNSPIPLSFSSLQKEISTINHQATNFSFHLKTLKSADLIDSSQDGYEITNLGRRLLKSIISIEHVLNDVNKTIMIRTSRYTKEPFDNKKIEAYLINEGQMEPYRAKQIAQEVEERLSKTSIAYLTTPLMREYINAVLLENGLEEVRHKLTRLGSPPSDTLKFFRSEPFNPEQFIYRVGSEVSEQFLLLNLLPKDLSDLYLSGAILLLNLNAWGLRPLGFFIHSESMIDFLSKKCHINVNRINGHVDAFKLILELLKVINLIRPFYSEDLLLGDFLKLFLFLFERMELTPDISNFFWQAILNLNGAYIGKKSHLTLDWFLSNEYLIKNGDMLTKVIALFQSIQNDPLLSKDLRKIHIGFNYSLFERINQGSEHSWKILPYSTIYLNQGNMLMNSSIINVNGARKFNNEQNRVIMDKIFINLYQIAVQSNQNDDLFYEILQQRVMDIFKLFNFKQEFIHRKLEHLKQFEKIKFNFFGPKGSDWLENAIFSISFFGLNEAVKHHCGIEFDRINSSEQFAYNLLKFMNELSNEKGKEENKHFCISQPHEDVYIRDYWRKISRTDQEISYSNSLFRKDSNLMMEKKIHLYKKFKPMLNGGCVFFIDRNQNKIEIENNIEKLKSSGINALSWN